MSNERRNHQKGYCLHSGSAKRAQKPRGELNTKKDSDRKKYIPLKFEKTLVDLALWVEKDQPFLETTSVLTPDFLELSHHPLLG
jgi:hypothetical protein